DKTVSAILAHAASSFPEECCGVVIPNGPVDKYIPFKKNGESPPEQFALNPCLLYTTDAGDDGVSVFM
ncbi:hypothetical protein ACVGV9_02525, partial [Enterobacter hormaechei]